MLWASWLAWETVNYVIIGRLGPPRLWNGGPFFLALWYRPSDTAGLPRWAVGFLSALRTLDSSSLSGDRQSVGD